MGWGVVGGGSRALKASPFPLLPLDKKTNLPALSQTRLSVTQLFPATQWTQQVLQGHWEEQLFLFFLFFSAGFQDARHPPSSPPTPPPTWPGGRSVTLTEGLEDAVAGLVVVLRVRPVGGVLRRTLLPLLVARPPAVAPPTPVALGHVHTDVNGVVTCQRGHREREGEREERVKLTELGRFGAFRASEKDGHQEK